MARSFGWMRPMGEFVPGKWEARAPLYLEASKASAQLAQNEALASARMAQEQAQFRDTHALNLQKQALQDLTDRAAVERDIERGGREEREGVSLISDREARQRIAERGAATGEAAEARLREQTTATIAQLEAIEAKARQDLFEMKETFPQRKEQLELDATNATNQAEAAKARRLLAEAERELSVAEGKHKAAMWAREEAERQSPEFRRARERTEAAEGLKLEQLQLDVGASREGLASVRDQRIRAITSNENSTGVFDQLAADPVIASNLMELESGPSPAENIGIFAQDLWSAGTPGKDSKSASGLSKVRPSVNIIHTAIFNAMIANDRLGESGLDPGRMAEVILSDGKLAGLVNALAAAAETGYGTPVVSARTEIMRSLSGYLNSLVYDRRMSR